MYCQNCGKEMSADARFCSACGASLGQRAVVAMMPRLFSFQTTPGLSGLIIWGWRL